jgi:hypothetical protein
MTSTDHTGPTSPAAVEAFDAHVAPALAALAGAITDVDEPLVRLELIAALEHRFDVIAATLKAFAARDAREAGDTWATIGDALGVTAQRAHQVARLDEAGPTPEGNPKP